MLNSIATGFTTIPSLPTVALAAGALAAAAVPEPGRVGELQGRVR